MANIALTNKCNLKCSYCFACDYREGEGENLTLSDFENILDFCAPDGEVGLIGGEPLLHKEIDKFLDILSWDDRFKRVTLFTNGLLIKEHIEALFIPKLTVLINVNSSKDISTLAFQRVREGIEALVKRGMGHQITLGINVYEENQDFSDFLSIVKEYGFKKIRLSVVIPNERQGSGIDYFYKMKPTLLALYRELAALSCAPCYDCNAIPECVYTEEEKAFLQTLPFANEYERQIFMGERSVCSPVIDIYPDYSATRCFGCYGMKKADIRDFKCITDLRNHFFMEIDSKLVHSYSRKECKDCYKHKTFACFGGCLCYKK